MKSIIAALHPMSKFLIFAILYGLAFQPNMVLAKIYKYKDDQGKTHFTDDASKIPLKYRKKQSMEKFKGVFDSDSSSTSSPGFSSSNNTQKNTKKGGEGAAEEGFSPEDEALAKKTIQVLKGGVALANRYKDAQPNFANVRGLIDGMQGALPQKESLAKELKGSKIPEFQEALAFLNSSIAEDKKNKSIGTGLKRAIAGIFSRVARDAEKSTALIEKIEKAIKEAEKKKKEEDKKKAGEKKKGNKASPGNNSGKKKGEGPSAL